MKILKRYCEAVGLLCTATLLIGTLVIWTSGDLDAIFWDDQSAKMYCLVVTK
jgi:hypothetical protein